MKQAILGILFLTCASIVSMSISASSNQWQGMPLAPFSLQDQKGQLRSNEDFTGKWLVLYFYPKDKTPGCTLEAQNFTDDYAKYKKLNVEIVGVSLDDVESHKDFSDTYTMPFILLADTQASLSNAMKVKRFFPWPHASRQTFLVNPQGVIVQHFETVNPKTHSHELLQAIKIHQK